MKNLIACLLVVILSVSVAYAYTEVSGDIESTTWTIGGDPYILTDNVRIPDGNILYIEPGVSVYAFPDVTFRVDGAIDAIGLEADSILFTGYTENHWDGFEFMYADKPCHFDYCRFEMGTTGNGRQNGGVIYTWGTDLYISNSLFFDNYSTHNCAGVYSIYSSVYLNKCTFAYNESSNSGIVGGDLGGNMEITYCLFHHNTAGIGSVLTTYPHEYIVDHCTIADNTSWDPEQGNIFYNNPVVSWEFTNSIIVTNQSASYGNWGAYYNVSANYSCLDENQLGGNNQVYEDPLFVDPAHGDYHLQFSSPCIDTGDPDYPLDPDGTITDMGCYPCLNVSVGEKELPTKINMAQAWPNPFNPSTHIELYLAQPSMVNISIYDVLGRRVATIAQGSLNSGKQSFTWNAVNQSAGTYFARVQAGGEEQMIKLMLLK